MNKLPSSACQINMSYLWIEAKIQPLQQLHIYYILPWHPAELPTVTMVIVKNAITYDTITSVNYVCSRQVVGNIFLLYHCLPYLMLHV